jgi:hypothetical protein
MNSHDITVAGFGAFLAAGIALSVLAHRAKLRGEGPSTGSVPAAPEG